MYQGQKRPMSLFNSICATMNTEPDASGLRMVIS